LVHPFLRKTAKKLEKSAKFVNMSPMILMNCRFISENNLQIYTLLVDLREGNGKSPGTTAHICKPISEIPGIS